MYGKFENLPENIKGYVKALQGISYSEWQRLSFVISKSFDKKIGDASKDICISSENDIVNPF